MLTRDKWLSVGGNLLPVVGVVVFGWDAAPAIFVLWLDTFLRNVQFVVTLASVIDLSEVKAKVMPPPQPEATAAPRWFGSWPKPVRYLVAAPLAIVGAVMLAWVVLCVLGAAVFLSFPALGIGILLYAQLDPHYPAGVLTAVFAAPGMGLWIFLNVAAWLMQLVVKATGAASGRQKREAFRASAPGQYLLLYNRCAVLEFLIWISTGLGHFGLILFLLLASAFVSYVDTRENWLEDIKTRCRKWQHARTSASRDDSQVL